MPKANKFSHVKCTKLCIEPNAKPLKSFRLQSQLKMLSDSRLPGDPRAWPFTRLAQYLIFTHGHPDHIGGAAEEAIAPYDDNLLSTMVYGNR